MAVSEAPWRRDRETRCRQEWGCEGKDRFGLRVLTTQGPTCWLTSTPGGRALSSAGQSPVSMAIYLLLAELSFKFSAFNEDAIDLCAAD